MDRSGTSVYINYTANVNWITSCMYIIIYHQNKKYYCVILYNQMANLSPSTLRYFLRCSADTSDLTSLRSLWKYCNTLVWYSEKEYYITHGKKYPRFLY